MFTDSEADGGLCSSAFDSNNAPRVFTDRRIESLEITNRTLASDLVFKDCRIVGMRLSASTFTGNVVFDNCAFENTVKIKDCRFESSLSFRSCNMVFTEFENTSISGCLDLTLSRFTQMFDVSGCFIGEMNLSRAIVLESFNMNGARISEGVCLNDATINGDFTETFTDDWKNTKKELEKNNSCTGLANIRKILENEMKYSAADDAFVSQKRKERQNLSGARAVLSDISYLFGGYGMKPQYTLGLMAILILLFTLTSTHLL